MDLIRLHNYEDKIVKFGIGTQNETTVVTLIYSKDFENEMEIRFTTGEMRFTVRGHKCIMDNWTFDEFKQKVYCHLSILEKKIMCQNMENDKY